MNNLENKTAVITRMKNLSSTKIDKQIILRANDSRFTVMPFYKTQIDFSNDKEREIFIKSIEQLVRKSATYKAYILYLKEKIGLRNCMKFNNLNDSICPIEMHHGPIFTLYDYVEITLNYFLKNNLEISTFSIAKQILEDHTNNLIQVVMLSQMAHEAVHARKGNETIEFLDINSAWGDLFGYLIKYEKALTIKQFNKLNKYFDLYNKYKESDNNKNDIFKGKITHWRKYLESKM